MNGKLEQDLLGLAARLEVPAAPDVVPAVMARLPARPSRRRLPVARPVFAALATVLLLVGAAMALPPTRHAILRVLGLRGVSIERVRRLPPLPPGAGGGLDLGRRIPVVGARHAASFRALMPIHADAAYVGRDVPGGRISLLDGRVLIIEFRGTAMPYILKLIATGTRVTRLRVNGGPGVYISGAPHELLFEFASGEVQTDRIRLAGNVLIWQQGRLTLRIEGAGTLRQALSVARSLR